MLLALLAFIVSKLISAYRLNNFYRQSGLHLSVQLNVKLYLLAMYYSLFIPGVGGDGFKVYWLNKKYGFEVKKSIWIAFLDRLSGLVALVSLSLLFLFYSRLHFPYKIWILALIPLAYIGFYVVLLFFSKQLLAIYGISSVQSFLVQALQVLCVYCIVKSLGITNAENEYILIFLVSSLAYVIPVFGVREASFVFGSQWLGLNSELSAAISLLFYCCLAITSLLGMYFFFFPQKIHEEQGRYSPIISNTPN